MFLLLCEDLEADLRAQILDELTDPTKRCLLDLFTQDFCRTYNSVARIMSQDALQHLRAIAYLARVDIAFLEAKHASLRRTSLRGLQTWMASLLQIAANMLLMQRRKQEKRRFHARLDESKPHDGKLRQRRRRGPLKKFTTADGHHGRREKKGPSMTLRAQKYRKKTS